MLCLFSLDRYSIPLNITFFLTTTVVAGITGAGSAATTLTIDIFSTLGIFPQFPSPLVQRRCVLSHILNPSFAEQLPLSGYPLVNIIKVVPTTVVMSNCNCIAQVQDTMPPLAWNID